MSASKNKNERRTARIRMLVSFLLAILVYMVFYLWIREERIVAIPLHVKESASLVSVSNIPKTVTIKIKGKEDLIYSVNPDYINAILDCTSFMDPGIHEVPVKLEYSLGFIDSFRIEIENLNPSVRVFFDKNEK